MQTSAIFVGSTTPWPLLATHHVIIEASFPPTSCRSASPPIVRSMTTAFGTKRPFRRKAKLDDSTKRGKGDTRVDRGPVVRLITQPSKGDITSAHRGAPWRL